MAAGSYGEGAVQDIFDKLQGFKQKVQKGEMSILDYQSEAEPLVAQAAQLTGQIAGKGSAAANAVNPIWQQFQSGNFVSAQGGKWVPQIPFSRQEYSKLPEDVLPTQDDVKSGTFDPSSVPFERYKQTTPQVNPGTSPTAPANPNNLPQVTPNLPTNIDLRSDRGQLAQQGQYNSQILQDALNKQYDVNKQAVSQLGDSLSGIPDLYRQEGLSQEAALNQLASQQKDARSQGLTDLASILAQDQMNKFNQAIPDLAEQANTKGIYRSTGFGNILAQKYADLTKDTQTQLALRGISDRDLYLQAQQDALNKRLGFSEQGVGEEAFNRKTIGSANAAALQGYGSGLGDVANAAIGMNNAGLQRQFNLQDYLTQVQTAKDLAEASKPKTSGKTGTQQAIQTGLGVANTATAAYGAANPKGKG